VRIENERKKCFEKR